MYQKSKHIMSNKRRRSRVTLPLYLYNVLDRGMYSVKRTACVCAQVRGFTEANEPGREPSAPVVPPPPRRRRHNVP